MASPELLYSKECRSPQNALHGDGFVSQVPSSPRLGAHGWPGGHKRGLVLSLTQGVLVCSLMCVLYVCVFVRVCVLVV